MALNKFIKTEIIFNLLCCCQIEIHLESVTNFKLQEKEIMKFHTTKHSDDRLLFLSVLCYQSSQTKLIKMVDVKEGGLVRVQSRVVGLFSLNSRTASTVDLDSSWIKM